MDNQEKGIWELMDQESYNLLTKNGIGQICNDYFSECIEKYASDCSFKNYLEIGTWNGLGSTKAFNNGFIKRIDDYKFYSLECNKDKCNDAKKLYKNNKNMILLNEVIWNEEPDDFHEIFPQIKEKELFFKWNEVDINNMKKCNLFLKRDEVKNIIWDVVLLDGGEFTTYHEFKILEDKIHILMLDDIKADKCIKIVKELRLSKNWKILIEGNIRNGFLIAERIN
tara:strand:+ start:209 stop:883 length:675 start_codon:yes stop_codon:yes gene_type:complete